VKRVLRHFEGNREIVAVDGARILFRQGWGLVRASNTQPVLVMRFEAPNAEPLAEYWAEVETAVSASKAEALAAK
jgi:phosphomannomutase/phosphoglucomutase